MLAAAKEEIFSASGDPRVCFSLVARQGVVENSRPGFARKNVALHQGSALAKSRTALRDRRSLAPNMRRMSLLPQTPTSPKKPCTQLQNQAKGVTQLAEADHAVEGPLLFSLFPAGSAAVLGGMGTATGYA